MNMRQIVTVILILACVAVALVDKVNGTPPRQHGVGVIPLDERVGDGPVHLQFFYWGGFREWKTITLEFIPKGNLTYIGPNRVPITIRRDSTTTYEFEVIPDQGDTSGIALRAWIDDLDFSFKAGCYFVPTQDSIIMRGSDPWDERNRPTAQNLVVEPVVIRSGGSTGGGASAPPDSAKIRARMEQQKRDFAPHQLELELHEKALLEQSPLSDLDAQHIRVGDTIFTRKKGEQYFYPAEKVSSSSPPLWAIDTKAFLDKMLDEEESPYHLSVACPDSACIEFLNDIADTVFLVPWSDRYQVTLSKKGLKKLREKDYKVLPGEHINTAPKQEE